MKDGLWNDPPTAGDTIARSEISIAVVFIVVLALESNVMSQCSACINYFIFLCVEFVSSCS